MITINKTKLTELAFSYYEMVVIMKDLDMKLRQEMDKPWTSFSKKECNHLKEAYLSRMNDKRLFDFVIESLGLTEELFIILAEKELA